MGEDKLGIHLSYNEEDEKLISELQNATGLTKNGIFKLGLRALKNDLDQLKNSDKRPKDE